MAETLRIVIEGKDKASGAFRGLLGSLQRVGEYAMGQLVARAIPALTRGLASLGKMAIGQVGAAQQLEMALGGLLTQSLMYEKVNQVRTATLRLTEKEQLQLQGLRANLDGLNVRLDKARYNYNVYLEAQGAAGIDTRNFAAMVATLEANIGKTTLAISTLEGKEGKLVSTTEQVWEQTMGFAEAQAEAAKQVKELTKFIDLLSIESPFKRQQVEMVTKYSLQAAMGTERTKEFTAAFLDFAAAQGISSENLGFAAEQFMQLRKLGKLTTIDLRQLRRLGIDVSRILGIKMSMSVEEFNAQVGKSPELMDELFDAFIELASETTADAAKKMALTLPGMMANLQDIMEVGSRDLFRPMIEAVSPALLGLLEKLKAFVLGPELKAWAKRLADNAVRVIDFIKNWDTIWANFKASVADKIGELKRAFEEEGFVAAVEKALSFVGVDIDFSELVADLKAKWDNELVPGLQAKWAELKTTFSTEGWVAAIETALSFTGITIDFSELGAKLAAAWKDLWLGKLVPSEQITPDTLFQYGTLRAGGLQQFFTEVGTKIEAAFAELGPKIAAAWTNLWLGKWQKTGEKIEVGGELLPVIERSGLKDKLAGIGADIWTAFSEKFPESAAIAEELFAGLVTKTGDLVTKLGELVTIMETALPNVIETGIVPAIRDLLNLQMDNAYSRVESLKGILEASETILTSIGDLMGIVGNNTEGWNAALDTLSGWLPEIMDALTPWDNLLDSIRKHLDNIAKGLDLLVKYRDELQLGLGGAGRPSSFQGGIPFAPGGMAWVGERGPELVNLPAGSRVHSARESRGMGGDTYQITIHAGGVPAYAIEGATRRGILSARRARGLR